MTRTAWWAMALLALTSPAAAQSPSTSPDSTAHAQAITSTAPSLGAAVAPTPPDFPRGRISGLVFADYYYNAVGDPTHVYSDKGVDAGKVNIDGVSPITRDLNGVQLRRAYLQLDNDLSARVATRVLLEADGKEFTSSGKVTVFVKQAYVQGKSVLPRMDFLFGMLKTPLFEVSEEFWAYRSVEKTIADFWGLSPSSDFGVEVKGFADPDHHLGYAAMIGDGTGQKPETDRYKKYYLSLPARFGDLRVEPSLDYQAVRVDLTKNRAHTDSLGLNNDQADYKIFAGYEFKRMALGAEALTRVNHKVPSARTTEPRGISVFARGTLTPTLAALARFDAWTPDSRAAACVNTRLYIVGVDWQPMKDVHLMPNVEATEYVPHGTGPASVPPKYHDLQARVTLYYRFSRPQS
jgi:hypothetical protein